MTNPFSSPKAIEDLIAPDPAPRPRDLLGCLVAYMPRSITLAGAPGNEEGVAGSEPRDRITADLVVLKTPNGPIQFGGSPEYEKKPTPHYLTILGPARFENVWVSQSNIVRFALTDGNHNPLTGQLVLGVIERSTFGNMPFNLTRVDGPNGEMTPAMQEAIDIYTRLSMGALAYNTPQPIPGAPIPQNRTAPTSAPMPSANSVNYGYATAPSPTPPAPTAWTTPPVPQPPTPPVPPAPAQPDMAAFQAWQAQQALINVGLNPVPQPPVPTPPPVNGLEQVLKDQGWTPESWATLSDNEKSQIRVSVGLPPF